jgi:hypothetical protein
MAIPVLIFLEIKHSALSVKKHSGRIGDRRLSPFYVTISKPPTFSVMSMRPSGREAILHGNFNVAT